MAVGLFKAGTSFCVSRRPVQSLSRFCRVLSTMATERGLVLGVYEGAKEGEITLSSAAQKFSSTRAANLPQLIEISGLNKKNGKTRAFYGVDADYSAVAVVKIGKQGVGFNEQEEIDEGKENIRVAVAAGVKQLQESGIKSIAVDPCGDAQAAAEGANLCLWKYDELKAEDKRKPAPEVCCYTDGADGTDSLQASWTRGTILAEGQNLARRLMETPANHMTPTRFAEIATDIVGKLDKVEVRVRDKAWAESMKMGAFLSVSQGSSEPLKFVEIEYKGGKEGDAPFAIVGKGITFDSGGISLKPSASMDEMRADMGGGACTLASIYTAARLQLPVNIMGFIPLCENMPGNYATKPGDVHTAMNGKTIQIDNTDAEGRLILCDALCYAQTFSLRGIMDMATLTGAMGVALGAGCTGVFTNNTQLWTSIYKAGTMSGDRMWRMPVWKHYAKQVGNGHLADMNNISGARAGGSCVAAAFLKEFVTHDSWMHLDIAGVMSNKSDVPYLCKGMAGRPTRTVVEFLNLLSQQ